jgi:hypothetical protein
MNKDYFRARRYRATQRVARSLIFGLIVARVAASPASAAETTPGEAVRTAASMCQVTDLPDRPLRQEREAYQAAAVCTLLYSQFLLTRDETIHVLALNQILTVTVLRSDAQMYRSVCDEVEKRTGLSKEADHWVSENCRHW